MSHSRSSSNGHQFGDTTLTKVFVGGLAWETPQDSLREHFEQYGDILEAVIICDKLTGRSKGYGFVTFKEAEAAAKACEDSAPLINGRRANCNLASLGAKREKSVIPTLPPSPSPPLPQTVATGNIPIPTTTNGASVISAGQFRWYYPAPTPPPPPHQVVPYYGYSHAYVAANNMNYNQKMSLYNNGGYYSNGQMYPMAAGHQMMPMYPLYQYHNQSMSFPANVFPTVVHRVPALIPKPTTTFVSPNPGAMVGV